MVNVFISYKREQRAWVKKLVLALERHNLTVWWDSKIDIGEDFNTTINRVLLQADCILVIWSKESIHSQWVISEALVGQERKNLIPILVDDVVPPVPFNVIQSSMLQDWNGEKSDPSFQELLYSIKKYSHLNSNNHNYQKKDNEQWEKALVIDRPYAYKLYLKNYPSGRHCKEATKRIKSVILKRQLILFSIIVGLFLGLIIIKKAG